jgi:hypothetical protein
MRKIFVGLLIMSFLMMVAPVISTNAGIGMNERSTVESYVVESAHNYANNFDYTWTITKSGATQIRCYFEKIDVENNYDYVYVYDYNNAQLHKLTGGPMSGWSAWSYGETIKVRLDTDYSVTDYGFKVTQIEYEGGGGGTPTGDMGTGGDAYNSYGASDSATILATPASGTGTLTHSADQYDQFKVAVNNGDEVTVDFTAPSGATGLDVVIYDTDKSAFFTRSNVGTISETVTAGGNGYVYITLDTDATADSGTYSLSVDVGGAPADTQAPSVSITNPSNGATVSGTVSISFSATDNVGVTSREISIDGNQVSTSSSYSWDTTAYANGAHTILCEAWDAAGNRGYDQHSVTVSNTVTDDGGPLSDGVTANGHMDQADGADMWYIDVDANALSMEVILTCGSSDFDTFGRFGVEPTTSTYDWRGYTAGGEENTVNSPAEGRHYIMVDWYSGDDDYTLTATITYGGGGSWGNGGKYAIIVGISDYASISDLSYCDEDATDWYNFLTNQGYECHVYGDGHTSNYPRYDGTAYESTVRAAMTELAAHAQAGDEVIFTTSGHGAGDGSGSSYLCMYECSGSAGCYYDTELASDISQFDTGVNMMVFIDHCYSGGMGPELMALSHNIYCTTTCTEDGYGYDDPSHNNGAWTYEYLERYWVGSPSSSAESIYDSASSTYPHSGGDACMEFDGFPGSFYL